MSVPKIVSDATATAISTTSTAYNDEVPTNKTTTDYKEFLEVYDFMEVKDESPVNIYSSTDIIEENSNDLIEVDDGCEKAIEMEDGSGDNSDEVVKQEYVDVESSFSSLYHCVTCNTDFPSVSDHINEFHSGEEIIIQSEDEADDTPLNDLITKVSKLKHNLFPKRIPKKQFQCLVCNKIFQSLKTLNNHKLKHQNVAIEPNLECPICLTVFMSKKSLKLHARMHNANLKQKTMDEIKYELGSASSKTFECSVCDIRLDLSLKTIHMQMHNSSNGHVCATCNKRFAKVEHLKLHSITHAKFMTDALENEQNNETTAETESSNNKKLKYKCKYCNHAFGRPHEKVKHERIHTGEKPYSCEVCGKTFRVTYCLTLHMRTHTNERPFVCQICNKRFKSNSVYNHHLLTHSDVRAYQCTEIGCSKTFKTAVQLSGHKNSHTKPFKCTDCGRTFATLYAVRNHMESHKKPNHNLKHSCPICGASYARGFALKEHMNEQHPGVEVDIKDEMKTGKKEFSRGIHKSEIDVGVNDAETEVAEQSILQEDSRVEIYSDIDQFATEEVITDWLR